MRFCTRNTYDLTMIKTINKTLNCNGNQFSSFLQFLSNILVVYTVKLYKSVR